MTGYAPPPLGAAREACNGPRWPLYALLIISAVTVWALEVMCRS